MIGPMGTPGGVGYSARRSRIGAYILPGDPVWLASSLSRYYPLLDDLVVVAPLSRRGWTGNAVPVDECIGIVEALDARGISRVVWGEWENHKQPMRAETAQRQAGLDALGDTADWVLQIDNDEILPDPTVLLDLLDMADERSVGAVEWPMRVLFRKFRNGDYLEVCAADCMPSYDYPGPIAWFTWWPAPVTWRMMRDFHPFARGLWPRLGRTSDFTGLLVPADR